MPERTVAIVNPVSRYGSTGRRWPGVQAKLESALGPLSVEWTRGPRDAARIAREAVLAGAERLVIAGGDGTLSEVATGLLAADLGGRATLAPLPLGTGRDLARTVGLAPRLDDAIARIAEGKARPIDAGRATYVGPDGGETSSFFLNVASLGISGLTAELVTQANKQLGGRISFLIGTVRSILRYTSRHVTLRVDGELVYDAPLVLATAANGRYFGSGMQVAPEARPDDGLLDVVIIPQLSKVELLRRLPLIYRGTHVAVPGVKFHRGGRVEAAAPSADVLLELDGEAVGRLPVLFEVLPGAISLVGWAV